MSYQVIARKWRPQTFADVVGQQHVTRTLENAIREGRVAHAYIFSGARGVGKTTTARILAKALNCVNGPTPTPCNECDSCREITAGNSLDVLEIDAASNRGIDQVRELRDMVRYAPAGGRYKVVILDEAHMLTAEASNALLKTLEEPPDKVVFVMATTQPEDLAETIRSRSQHFHFRALSFAEIVEALGAIASKEGLEAEPGALAVMARAADGSLRDALSLLEQARAYCGDKDHRSAGARTAGRGAQRSARRTGRRHRSAFRGARARAGAPLARRRTKSAAILPRSHRPFPQPAGGARLRRRFRSGGRARGGAPAPGASGCAFSEEDLTRFFQILLHTEDDLRRKPDPRLHLEMGLLRLVNAARLAPLEEILAELSGGNAAPRRLANPRGASTSTASAHRRRGNRCCGCRTTSASPSPVPQLRLRRPSLRKPWPRAAATTAPSIPQPISRPAAQARLRLQLHER